MLDNNSTSSLTSLQDERPERKRHQGWRKPVPQYAPDPPKKPSLLANASALRRMALLTSGDERPPLPTNWRENIEIALGKETLDVERPASPTPDSVSSMERASSHGVTKTKPTLASSKLRVEKALPMVPSLEANRQSDCGSTLVESTRSMKLEASEQSSTKSIQSSRTRSSSSIKDRSSASPPPPSATHDTRRGEDGNSNGLCGPADAPYCIVYPRGLGTKNLDTTRRHVAVYPVFPGSNADLSVYATVVDSREDIRSTRNPHSISIPSLLKPGASSVRGSDEKCGPLHAYLERRPDSLCRRIKHAFCGCLCLNATTHKY